MINLSQSASDMLVKTMEEKGLNEHALRVFVTHYASSSTGGLHSVMAASS